MIAFVQRGLSAFSRLITPHPGVRFSSSGYNPEFDRLRTLFRTWSPVNTTKHIPTTKHERFGEFVAPFSQYLDHPDAGQAKKVNSLLDAWRSEFCHVPRNIRQLHALKVASIGQARSGMPVSELEIVTTLISLQAAKVFTSLAYSEFNKRHIRLAERILNWAASKQNNRKIGLRILNELQTFQ